MNNKTYYILFILISLLAVFTRFFKVTSVPPSLYWEEVALGYDAYSIAKTGRDHHGNFMPIVAFESFGDWKPSGYFYALVPFVSTLGLSELAVRLPSMISGVLLVIIIGQISGLLAESISSKKSSKKSKSFNSKSVTLITMAVASISPWAIIFSRGGWEVNLATFLLTLGAWLFIKLIIKIKNEKLSNKDYFIHLAPTSLFFILSMYTYHSTRVIIPLLIVGMVISWISSFPKDKLANEIKNRIGVFILLGLLSFVLLLPLGIGITDKKVSQRFAETSIFSDLTVIEKSNELKNSMNNSLSSKIIYHRYVLFGREIIENYLSHLKIDFLFVNGDQNPRHSIQYFGHLYHLEFIFILMGVYFLVKNRNKLITFCIYWLAVGIIPASITLASPHALRILPVMPVFMIMISFGSIYLFTELKKVFSKISYSKELIFIIFAVAYSLEFTMFWNHYIKVYPKVHAHQWQVGYKEMVQELNLKINENPNNNVYISRDAGRPAMYYWFFSKTDPIEVQRQDEFVKKDQGEFLEFGNIKFENYDINNKKHETDNVIYAKYHEGEWGVN